MSERTEKVAELRRFLEHAPKTALPSPVKGWRVEGVHVCGACAGRIMARGCVLGAGAEPIWEGDVRCDVHEQDVADNPCLDYAEAVPGLEGGDAYLYHVTSREALDDIAKRGLVPHEPWHGTDQDRWPDGGVEPRVYFSSRPENIWQFAPEFGPSAVLRVRRDAAKFRHEIAGDFFTRKEIPPNLIEALCADHSWQPLTASNPPLLNEAFWEWFGDSQIVDAEGKPLVVYHGSKNKISQFEISAGGEYGRGIYFSADPNTAWKFADFARGPGGVQIYPVYLSMQRPFRATREEARAKGPRKLMSEGYDGIIGTAPSGEVQYVVFKPEQVKSAIGNDNTWDKDDPDIRSNPMYPTTEEKFEMANPAAPAVSGYEGMRVEYSPAKKLPFAQPFREPQDIVGFARANRLMDDTRERFYTVYLNQQNAPLGYRLIGAGGPSSAPVDPAVVFGPAMALQASSVIFLHNHPSGTAKFSASDIGLTERLLWVARMMGLRVLDHVLVVPSGGSLSMREEHPNLMWEYDPAARAIDPNLQLERAAAENPGDDVDVEELALGTLHEMEHTNDPEAARQIALDHLAEHPDYYSQLLRCFGHSNPVVASNPPWADKLFKENWYEIQQRVNQMGHPDWLPEWTANKRNVVVMPELGCGHYGCTYTISSNDPVVVKITTDATEATFIAIMEKLKREGWEPPRGIVRYYGIYALKGTAKRRTSYILWRELAIEAGLQAVQSTVYQARMEKGGDAKQTLLVIKKAVDIIQQFKDVAHFAFEVAFRQAKKLGEAEYYAWLLRQKEQDDEGFWERWNDLSDKYGSFPDPYGYSGKYRDLLKGIRDAYREQRFAWYVFVCRRIAEEMASSDVSYLIGEAMNEFMDQDLLLADVHLNNIGIVASAPRDDNDMPANIPVIFDPGHVVPLSDRYAQVEVEMI